MPPINDKALQLEILLAGFITSRVILIKRYSLAHLITYSERIIYKVVAFHQTRRAKSSNDVN